MQSCLYEGVVTHARVRPVDHAFRYRMFMAYLDLDELAGTLDSVTLLSRRRFAPASFLRDDHLGPIDQPLAVSVREHVRDKVGIETRGPVRILTQLRYFGAYFSPINLFYLFDETETRIEAVVAEVSNTPWLERHHYILWEGNCSQRENKMAFSHCKEFHVSPFMDMDAEYRWQLTSPAEQLSVQLSSFNEGRSLFQANMTLTRRPLDNRHLACLLLRYPVTSARITMAIYFQALKLWLKKCPFFPHPK